MTGRLAFLTLTVSLLNNIVGTAEGMVVEEFFDPTAESFAAPVGTQARADEIRAAIASFPLYRGYLATYIDQDARKLNPLVGVIITLILIVAFLSARGAILPNLIVLATVAIAGLAGLSQVTVNESRDSWRLCPWVLLCYLSMPSWASVVFGWALALPCLRLSRSGWALLFNFLAVALGFGVLVTSDVPPLVKFGWGTAGRQDDHGRSECAR